MTFVESLRLFEDYVDVRRWEDWPLVRVREWPLHAAIQAWA